MQANSLRSWHAVSRPIPECGKPGCSSEDWSRTDGRDDEMYCASKAVRWAAEKDKRKHTEQGGVNLAGWLASRSLSCRRRERIVICFPCHVTISVSRYLLFACSLSAEVCKRQRNTCGITLFHDACVRSGGAVCTRRMMSCVMRLNGREAAVQQGRQTRRAHARGQEID